MVDAKDHTIIEMLRKDANLSSQAISRKTGIPITTVHYRLRNLRKQGVIRGQTALVDYRKLGRGYFVYVIVYLDIGEMRKKALHQNDLIKKIKRIKGVEKADIITGQGSFLLQVRVADQKEYSAFLLDQLQQLEGIQETKSLVVIQEDGETLI